MEPTAAVTVQDVADLLLSARGRIDFYWNFYLAVVVAVIGWLVSRKLALTTSLKLLVTLVYLVAATLNLMGLYSAYTLAEALRLDLLAIEASAELSNTSALLDRFSYLPLRRVAVLVHLLVAAAVLAVVWLGRFFRSEPR